MLKAIEMGIITEATRTRMVELETEQSRLSVQLNAAKEDVVKIDREQIISYLELLQQGDIHDRDFQMELFKNFLVAVYVYDDNRMKLVSPAWETRTASKFLWRPEKTRPMAGCHRMLKCSF